MCRTHHAAHIRASPTVQIQKDSGEPPWGLPTPLLCGLTGAQRSPKQPVTTRLGYRGALLLENPILFVHMLLQIPPSDSEVPGPVCGTRNLSPALQSLQDRVPGALLPSEPCGPRAKRATLPEGLTLPSVFTGKRSHAEGRGPRSQ